MELRSRTFDMPRSLRAATGFTLVELMMTVLIGAILMAVAIPSLRGAMANNRLTTQTNDMIAAITLARSQAITLNQPVTFCRARSEASITCSAFAGSWRFWIVRTAAGTVVRRGATPTTALTVTSTFTNNQVTFGSDGLARTNNVLVTGGPHITVCSTHSATDNKRQVTLGASSRVSTATASGATCP